MAPFGPQMSYWSFLQGGAGQNAKSSALQLTAKSYGFDMHPA
jgi:hypothetical protein